MFNALFRDSPLGYICCIWPNSKAGKSQCSRCHHASCPALVDLRRVLLWRRAGNPKFLMRGPTPQEKVSFSTLSNFSPYFLCPFFYNFEASNIKTSFIYIYTVKMSCCKFGQQTTQNWSLSCLFCNSFRSMYDDKLSLTSINVGPMVKPMTSPMNNPTLHKESHQLHKTA